MPVWWDFKSLLAGTDCVHYPAVDGVLWFRFINGNVHSLALFTSCQYPLELNLNETSRLWCWKYLAYNEGFDHFDRTHLALVATN